MKTNVSFAHSSFAENVRHYIRTAASVIVLLLAAGGLLQAQVKFYASAPKSVPANQNFQLSFTVENGNGSGLKMPAVSDFQILGGPNTSSSMQWVNGNVSQSVSYTYILRPKKEGTFKIGKASVNVSGATMESNELTIQVTAPVAQQQAQQRQRGWDPFADDPFFNEPTEPEPAAASADIEKQLRDDVIVKLVVNDNSVYKGEMLTATYRLYFRQNLAGFNITKAPSFDGFWSQEVTLDPNRRPTVETINGKQYNVVDILKYNLYPQRTGSLPISAAEVSTVAQVQVRSRSRNFFDDFFNAGRVQQIPLNIKVSGANIQARELPINGQPEGFSGAVGQYSFETKMSSKTTKTDEPVTYSVKISGSGNLKMIELPSPPFPDGFEVYDPKVKENISNTAGGMSGSKQYDYLLVPRQPGDYTIGGYSFSYFDPTTSKYQTIRSPEFTVKVTGEPSPNVNATTTYTASKKEVDALAQDIRYIKTTTPEFAKSSEMFFGSGAYWGMYATPLLMFIGLAVWKKRNEELAADVVGAKRRRALKLAKKRLRVAEGHLAKNNKQLFYDEVSKAMWGYLSDKLNIDTAELSKENVEEKLLLRSAGAETVAKLKALLNTCELALYAPVGDGGEMKSNYQLAVELIADMEDQIKQAPTTNYAASVLPLLVCTIGALSTNAATPETLYKTAAEEYKAGKISSATAIYEQLIKQGYKSAEIYYNLGNCYYHDKQNGKSILNYERALRLAPNDEDALHNLQLANQRVTDKIIPVPQLAIVSGWKNMVHSHSAGFWGLVSFGSITAVFMLLAVMLFSDRKRPWLLGAILGTAVAIATLAIAFTQRSSEINSGYAVIIAPTVTAKNAPTNNGSNAFTIHEGTKVEMLDNVSEWHKVRLADGKQGWLPRSAFEKI